MNKNKVLCVKSVKSISYPRFIFNVDTIALFIAEHDLFMCNQSIAIESDIKTVSIRSNYSFEKVNMSSVMFLSLL